jgi:hypothetical protein
MCVEGGHLTCKVPPLFSYLSSHNEAYTHQEKNLQVLYAG